MTGLQERIADYHRRRFPTAGPLNVAAKIGEEAGELLSAVNGLIDSSYGKGDTVYEAVDVVLAALALVGRWFPDRDVLAEVEARLDRFMDPNGGHRSCIKPDPAKTLSGGLGVMRPATDARTLTDTPRLREGPRDKMTRAIRLRAEAIRLEDEVYAESKVAP